MEVIGGKNLVTLNGSFPEIRRFAAEIVSGMPTQNDDGTSLVKYQTLVIMDGDNDYVWDGTTWQVMV